jgi:hypothetical protein
MRNVRRRYDLEYSTPETRYIGGNSPREIDGSQITSVEIFPERFRITLFGGETVILDTNEFYNILKRFTYTAIPSRYYYHLSDPKFKE